MPRRRHILPRVVEPRPDVSRARAALFVDVRRDVVLLRPEITDAVRADVVAARAYDGLYAAPRKPI